jgi:large subunit ribosomal protein L21
MKFAVIKTGGKQYKVKEGDKLKLEKIEGDAGKKIDFKDILLFADEELNELDLGAPTVKGKKVSGLIEKQFRTRKIIIMKFKSKTRQRKKQGHRQHQTLVKIEAIA